MKALVIGLGSSGCKLDGYDYYIGVNNCPFDVDDIVMVDPPRVFSAERRKQIIEHPARLVTSCLEWHGYRQNVKSIQLTNRRFDLSLLHRKESYPHSVLSPFVAVVHAYFMGATEIHLNGVDIYGHHALDRPDKIEIIRRSFVDLRDRLAGLGVPLLLATNKDGALQGFINRV